MAFKKAADSPSLVTFNSAASADFLDLYLADVDSDILGQNNEVKHKTFAPSSFRCSRLNWFRLRGVQPDEIKLPDRTLNFSAVVGTACHEEIQKRLSKSKSIEWLDVESYLNELKPDYTYSVNVKGFESLIEITDPPVRFACDGIIRMNGNIYLLEIKTSEFGSFSNLTGPKDRHIDQITCYCSLLGIHNALVLYQDRMYGSLKCFEMKVSDTQMKAVRDKMELVTRLAHANIAPEGLPKGDSWCQSNMCPYYKKCKEW